MTVSNIPSFDELPLKATLRHSWGLWGPDDAKGAVNLLTPERVRAARDHIVDGVSIPLDWTMDEPKPPLFGRGAFTRRLSRRSAVSQDETLDGLNTQSSSQWDGFRHVRSVAHGFYNGLADEQHGVQHWAQNGIVGRAVLADVARWRETDARPLREDSSDPITVADLEATLAAQGTTILPGDVLLIRTGWIEWYQRQDLELKTHIAIRGNLVTPGLEPVEDMARYLWNRHVSAIALDNPAMEVWPQGAGRDAATIAELMADPEREHEIQLHIRLMPMLGIPIGELFFLDRLADYCRGVGRYEMLFTSAPMNLPGGVASTPNAIALL
jgi:hypothetical protein